MPEERIIIIGAGAAGVSAAKSAADTNPDSDVILISKEPELPYYRLNLARYIGGEITKDKLTIHPEEWYNNNRIQLLCNTSVIEFDGSQKKLTLNDQDSISYDKLVIASGANPFILPLPGVDKKNFTPLRTISHADFILGKCRQPIQCLIIGGGTLGLETAGAVARTNAGVTILENQDRLLPLMLNHNGAAVFEKYIAGLGVNVITSAVTKEITGDDSVTGVLLADGRAVPADLIISSTGIRAEAALAEKLQLKTGRGIEVDNCMKTSLPDVFAAGDVAEVNGTCYGTWGPAQMQGKTAGTNAAGGTAEFKAVPRSNTLNVLDISIFSIGDIAPDDDSLVFESSNDTDYSFFHFKNGNLVGCILLGDTKLSLKARTLIQKKTDCSKLLSGNPSFEEVLSHIKS